MTLTLKEQAAADVAALFDATLPWVYSATYNGAAVTVCVASRELEQSADGMVDAIDVNIQTTDYQTLNYRTDTLVIDGETYRCPLLIAQHDYIKTVRWTKAARPRANR